MAAMDAVIATRRALLQKVAKLRETEPNFARILAAAVAAPETDALSLYAPAALEAMLRKT